MISQKRQIFRIYSQRLDAFSRVVDQADRKGAYLGDNELNALAAMIADSNKRLDVVNRLTANASSITANAYRTLVAEQPSVFGPGGACFHHRNQAACIRDLGFILRYVTYAVATGDVSVLDERCLNGLRETFVALGTPGATVASGIEKIKVLNTLIKSNYVPIGQKSSCNWFLKRPMSKCLDGNESILVISLPVQMITNCAIMQLGGSENTKFKKLVPFSATVFRINAIALRKAVIP